MSDTDHRWWQYAACSDVDTEVFFAETTGPALRICGKCPVQNACLEDALQYESPGRAWGVVGGMSSGQRAQLLRQRQQQDLAELLEVAS